MSVRVRFAPSPTGHVHIGNVRAAIYNWLFARHEGGRFLLRVEDTDRERSTPEAVDTLLAALDWLGLAADEEPVYQSRRTEAHRAAAEDLLRRGLAYREDKGGTGRGEAIVFRMPGRDIAFLDAIRGELRKPAADLADFVLVRSSGAPVFHLANVVDDLAMGITDVIRGDDHIENTYKHVALYEALGAVPPRFAHLPMIVNDRGKPYAKRDGDAYIGDFRAKGYLPDALFNYLALLGWSPGDDREMMSRAEMVEAFDLRRVKASAAQMDRRKLDWMNGEYIRRLSAEELAARCRAALETAGGGPAGFDEGYFGRVVEMLRGRLRGFAEFPAQAGWFLTEAYPYDEKAVRKRLLQEGALEGLRELRGVFSGLTPFTAAAAEAALRELAGRRGVDAAELVHPARVAVSGQAGGPGLFEMLEIMGRERVVARMDRTLVRFGGSAPPG